jgi:hypothetical protein
MDETDMTPATGPEAASAEAARQWAEQRRAQARAQFTTPSWIGPSRSGTGESLIPEQAEAAHDDFDDIPDVVIPQSPIPESAHWAEKARPRLVAGVLLVAALAGVITFLVLTITTQSVGAIAGLAASAIVAVIFRGALMGSGITTVDLQGSVMRVHQDGVLDVVNLADPVHTVELIGSPTASTWRLRVEAVDGRTIEIGPNHVDAPELHRIVEYYRAIADRERRERDRRFNR